MKREIKNGQGFICKDLDDKKRIWEKLIQHRYPMFADGNDPWYKHIMWEDGEFVETNQKNIEPLNEAEFFGENEWTPKPGDWVEASNNDIKYGNAQFCFEKDNLCYVTMPDQEIPDKTNMTLKVHAVLFIRQIKPETMTLQQAQEKLRELLNKPNLIIEPW
jgi:hypothetical protein